MILSEWYYFINCNFLGRCKKWGILLHKNLAILVPFECWMPKNPKNQDLTWRESPKNLARVSLEISTVLRDSWRIQVSRYPRVQWWKFPKNVSWIDLEKKRVISMKFTRILADKRKSTLQIYWNLRILPKKIPHCPIVIHWLGLTTALLLGGDGIGGESP